MLRSLTGKYIRVDEIGNVNVDSTDRFGASRFAAVIVTDHSQGTSENDPTVQGHAAGSNCTFVGRHYAAQCAGLSTPAASWNMHSKFIGHVHLKVCQKNQWLQEAVYADNEMTTGHAQGSAEGSVGSTSRNRWEPTSAPTVSGKRKPFASPSPSPSTGDDQYDDVNYYAGDDDAPSDARESRSLTRADRRLSQTVLPDSIKAVSQQYIMHTVAIPEHSSSTLLLRWLSSLFNRGRPLVGEKVVRVGKRRLYGVRNTTLSTNDDTGGKNDGDVDDIDGDQLVSSFHIDAETTIRGVNLGGWFIPEVWMNRLFYNGTGLGWGGSLCAMVNYSRHSHHPNPDDRSRPMRMLAEDRIMHQLDTWITEEDIREISQLGYNSVRLPVGYWNLIKDPYEWYAPADHKTSLKYIDACFDWAEKYNLTVLLDMHGGPGSQNGIDHSGCGWSMGPPRWILPQNIDLSLRAVEAMAKRYSGRSNLLGFELLNEPSQYYSENNHTALHNFYVSSYHIIRQYSATAWVVFNELYVPVFPKWNTALHEPHFYNVVIDWHLYQFMYERWSGECAVSVL